MTIGGGDDEKLSLENDPLYRKQTIPIATTTGREQKAAAKIGLEVIFGKQYEDTKEGEKAALEYSKLKRETDKLRPVFDDYIDSLRELLLEKNPCVERY